MTTEEEMNQLGREMATASDALLAKSLDQSRSFVEVVDDFRRLEAEFVARMGDNEFGVLQTRRRVAEAILAAAESKHPPFEVCREAWNNAFRLGFGSIQQECLERWLYVECCAYDEQPAEGLAVLEPLLAELERLREEARATQKPTRFYEDEIEQLGDLRDELLAQQRGQLSPGRITRRMDEAYQPTPEEERIDELHDALREGRSAVFETFAESRDRSFAEVATDYRKVEADIVSRAGEGEAFQALVLEVRQEIAKDILKAACMLQQPFEVCREAWSNLVGVGFTSFGKQCRLTEFYAESCGENQKPEEGLAVVEPLLAEFERGLEAELQRRSEARAKLEPPGNAPSPSFYRNWIQSLGELRDKLEAQRKGP